MASRVAVIDIGSNSARLQIMEKSSRFAFHLLHEEKSRIRISENSYANGGNLQEEAQQRAISLLKEFRSIIDSYKAKKVLVVATSALRDAPNKSAFISRVRKTSHLNIKVISGEKEAFLGALASANLLHVNEGITLDIGGGSSESAYINSGDIHTPHSLNLGTVRIKELFFDTHKEDEASVYIQNKLAKLPQHETTRLIGIGGTFRALSSIIIHQESYPFERLHGFEFSAKTMLRLIDTVLQSDEEGLKTLGIKANRLDVIKPGALILKHFIIHYGIKELVCSGVGVREGLYLSDLLRHEKLRFPDNFNPSVRYLIDTFCQDKKHANKLAKVAKEIFALTHESLSLDESYKRAVVIAAKLSHTGDLLHIYSAHMHAYYFIQNTLEYALSHKDIILISALVRYSKRKRLNKEFAKFKTMLPDEETLKKLTQILAISDILLSHRPRNIDFTLSYRNNTLHVTSKKALYLAKEKMQELKLQNLEVSFT